MSMLPSVTDLANAAKRHKGELCRNANAIAIQPEVYYKKAAYT